LLLLVLAGCSKEKTDSALLDLDKKQLAANINYDKIFFYKFVKIAVRASAMQDTTNEQYQKFGKHMKTVVKCLSKANSGKDDISVTDAFLMYKDYLAVRSFVVETDEDSFPTFIEGIRSMHGAEKTITPLLIKEYGTRSTQYDCFSHQGIWGSLLRFTNALKPNPNYYQMLNSKPYWNS
jgi:hypothetical protein